MISSSSSSSSFAPSPTTSRMTTTQINDRTIKEGETLRISHFISFNDVDLFYRRINKLTELESSMEAKEKYGDGSFLGQFFDQQSKSNGSSKKKSTRHTVNEDSETASFAAETLEKGKSDEGVTSLDEIIETWGFCWMPYLEEFSPHDEDTTMQEKIESKTSKLTPNSLLKESVKSLSKESGDKRGTFQAKMAIEQEEVKNISLSYNNALRADKCLFNPPATELMAYRYGLSSYHDERKKDSQERWEKDR